MLLIGKHKIPASIRSNLVCTKWGIGATGLAATALIFASYTSVFAQATPPTEIVPQLGHAASVYSVAFSPDGTRFISGGSDNTAKLWDMRSGALLRTFQHSEPITSVAFAPDGRRLAITSVADKAIRIWDARSGRIVHNFEQSMPARVVAFSPDGQQLLVGGFGTVNLFDTASARLVRSFEGHDASVNSVAYSPDAKQILSSDDSKAILWDIATGNQVLVFPFTSAVLTTAFAPDGRTLLLGGGDFLQGGENGFLELRDRSTGKLLYILRGHSKAVLSANFSLDGRQLVSGGDDETLRVWDVATGKAIQTIESKLGAVLSVALSPNGTQVLSGHAATVGPKLALWDIQRGRIVRNFEGFATVVTSVTFSPLGDQLLTVDWGDTVNVWGTTDGRLLKRLVGHRIATLSSDGTKLLSVKPTKPATFQLFDASNNSALRTFEGHTEPINKLALSPDGRLAASGAGHPFTTDTKDFGIGIWEIKTGKRLRTLGGHSGSVSDVGFSADGRVIFSASSDQTLKVWEVASGKLLTTLKGHSGAVRAAMFTPDGQQLVSVSEDHTAKIWNVGRGEIARTLEGHTGIVWSVALSPDGRWILTGSDDQSLLLWDRATGAQVRSFQGHQSSIFSVAFSPDSKRVASSSMDGTTRIWDALTGREIVRLFASTDGGWLSITRPGFFHGRGNSALNLVRGFNPIAIEQVHQSLFGPDLVREALAGDPTGEVAAAANVLNIDKVLDSGLAPMIAITSPTFGAKLANEIITAEATISAQPNSGIGRIEWRVNGLTVGVSSPKQGSGQSLTVKQTLALDPGDNVIEAVAYNGRNLLASVPARTSVSWTGKITSKPRLHVLAIGINNYVDKGGVTHGETESRRFLPLALAVPDARAVAEKFKNAGEGLYGDVVVRIVLDEEATTANLDSIVTRMAQDISPRDTFVLYAAAHGYSNQGRFYLIPQDYQGGPDPNALATRAIDQFKLQDWIANRIKAKKALILLDTCESGALTAGYSRSRINTPASDAAIGRLHESTGRPVLTAAGLGQAALELSELGHGVFTSALIDSFYRGDANGDGVVSVSELVAHVQEMVPRLIKDPGVRAEVMRRGTIGGTQSARFGGRGDDFLLVHSLE